MKEFETSDVRRALDEASPVLPESLSPEAIANALEGKPEKKKSNVRKFVAVAASLAAALFVTVGVLFVIAYVHRPVETRKHSTDRTVVTTEAETARSYLRLGESVNKAVKAEKTAGYSGLWYNFNGRLIMKSSDGMVVEEAAPEAPAAEGVSGVPTGGADNDDPNEAHSDLNTVVEGVDEADFFRTDGRYIYVLKNGRRYYRWFYYYDLYSDPQEFIIIDPNGGAPQKLSVFTPEESGEGTDRLTATRAYDSFYLYGNYAVLTGSRTEFSGEGIKRSEEGYWDLYGDVTTKRQTLVTVLDVSDPAAPTVVKDLFFDGDVLSSRMIGGKLITAALYTPDYETVNYKDYRTFVPCAGDGYVDAGNITVANDESLTFATVSVTDLTDPAVSTNSVAVMGCFTDVYCSKDNVYLYGYHDRLYDDGKWASVLDVQKVGVSGSAPEIGGLASIPNASLVNDFSLDEHNGFLRLALMNYSDEWSGRSAFVLVLDGSMKEVGRTEDFGKGEDIRAVRYSGDLAYVVTFMQTDPLFAVDLTDPTAPVIRGELKMPGYSAYLHPVGENLMLGVGYDGDDDGTNGDAKISLFDVTDPDSPEEIDRIVISRANLDSQYKSYLKVGDDGAILSYYKYAEWDDDGNEVTKPRAGLLRVKVEDRRLVTVWDAAVGGDTDDLDVQRAIWIGDEVYAYTYGWSWDEEKNEEHRYVLWGFSLETGEVLGELVV